MNSGILNQNGENFYPLTQANLVKTSDGETIESKISNLIVIEQMECTMDSTSYGWVFTSSPLNSVYAQNGYKLINAFANWGNGFNATENLSVRAILEDGRIILENKSSSMGGQTIKFDLVWAKC